MAKKDKATGDALATATPEELERIEAQNAAELAAFFEEECETDGLEDVGGEDVKLGSKIWNMSGLNKATGESYKKNEFLDTLTEEVSTKVRLVFLTTKKTHRYDVFDNAKNKTDVVCQSLDRKTGVMNDGTRRPCQGCPDFGWYKDEDGNNKRRCGEVHTVVGMDLDEHRPVVVRFKKTGLAPWRKYLMAHHWGVRIKPDGSRGNIGLFAYEAELSLALHESGKYAVPVIEKVGKLPIADVRTFGLIAKDIESTMSDALAVADFVEEKHADVIDGDFSSDDFKD